MATITVKNIPSDLYELLKASAASNRRSINSEVIVCIERSVRSAALAPGVHLGRARALRELTAEYRIADEELDQAKREGRS